MISDRFSACGEKCELTLLLVVNAFPIESPGIYEVISQKWGCVHIKG